MKGKLIVLGLTPAAGCTFAQIAYAHAPSLSRNLVSRSDCRHYPRAAAENYLFDYATRYRADHATLPPAREFHLSEAEYQKFIQFLNGTLTELGTKAKDFLRCVNPVSINIAPRCGWCALVYLR